MHFIYSCMYIATRCSRHTYTILIQFERVVFHLCKYAYIASKYLQYTQQKKVRRLVNCNEKIW